MDDGNDTTIEMENKLFKDEYAYLMNHVDEKKEIPPGCDRCITMNCGGFRHEILESTLMKYPETRLGDLSNLTQNLMPSGEYFFDRHPILFLSILNYYRTDDLHLPQDICYHSIRGELAYWAISEKKIANCCWLKFISHFDQMKTLEEFEKKNQPPTSCIKIPFNCRNKYWLKVKPIAWSFLEDPYSSKPAKALAIFSMMLVLVSTFLFCAETHPYFMVPKEGYTNESTLTANNVSESPEYSERVHSEPHPIIFYIDTFCYIFFTLELSSRLIFSEDKALFFLSAMNIVDLIAVLPFYIEMIINALFASSNENSILTIILITRIFRIFRVFRLFRRHKGLQILVFTIKASMKEIMLLLIFLSVVMVVFSSLMYYADMGSGSFTSIPQGFWWAIITMTTVGYGDVTPGTPLGYIVGSMCAISGVLVIAFTVPIIVNNFLLIYQYVQLKREDKIQS